MAAVTQYVTEGMEDLVETQSARAFSIACTFGLKGQALAAARASLQFSLADLLSSPEHFDPSSVLALRSLILHHTRCGKASIAVLRRESS